MMSSKIVYIKTIIEMLAVNANMKIFHLSYPDNEVF